MAKKKTPAKKPASKKLVKKSTMKKTAKKAVAKSSKKAVKKTTAKKSPAKKAAKKTPVKKTTVKKAALKKTSAPKKSAPKKTSPQATATAVSTRRPARDLSGFMTPLDDRILVQVSGSERMTAGGLYIPDTVADISGNLQGHVVAVGRGHIGKKGHIRPMDVKVGDRIVFPQHAGSKIKIENEDMIILREGDVLGVVSK